MIENPATGERIEFRQTRRTTGGDVLEFELTLAPCGRVGGLPHQHPATETVEVLEGRLSCRLGRERRELAAGDSIVLPAGRSHYLFNDTDQPVRAHVTARPARDFETFFEIVFAIAQRRRYKAFRGLPPPLHTALLAHTYEVYAPVVSIAIQRPVLAVLAGLARRRGYDATPSGSSRSRRASSRLGA